MKLLLMISSIVVPCIMLYLNNVNKKFHIFFNVMAVLSTLIFGNIAAASIFEIIVNDTVFMTEIHSVFLNPVFLITGAYIGVYIVYRLTLIMLEER